PGNPLNQRLYFVGVVKNVARPQPDFAQLAGGLQPLHHVERAVQDLRRGAAPIEPPLALMLLILIHHVLLSPSSAPTGGPYRYIRGVSGPLRPGSKLSKDWIS